MRFLVPSFLGIDDPVLKSRVGALFAALVAGNALAWLWAALALREHPALLGTALLAYTFGLRHAVDADHISAIDNVTRKLMHERKQPTTVGFYFSLGHSTIVVFLSVAIAIAAVFIKNVIPSLQGAGGIIGTSVSAFFLYVIAFINLLVLWEIFRTFRKVTRGENYNNSQLEDFLNKSGLMARFFRPLLKMTDKSWKMYPIGILFGLGFDTATEVGLLGITGLEASHGLPVIYILIFPLLFMAGMVLLDTTDGIL